MLPTFAACTGAIDAGAETDAAWSNVDGPAQDPPGDAANPGTPDAHPAAPDAAPTPDDGQVRAFPGAQGFGALATGGRGGRVIKVTTLAADGPGSLRAALDQDEPRIVVFDVSGVIEADIRIEYGDVTIAGQTAPGGGITIKGRLFGRYDDSVGNIIIRHLRVRPEYDGSDGDQFDAIQLSRNSVVNLDHAGALHGLDPADGDDHSTILSSGYTAIEVYINGLADALLP